MKRITFIIFLCLVSIGRVYSQYEGSDYYEEWENGKWVRHYYLYDAHDVDKLLAVKAANPQSDLKWSGNDYAYWGGCEWVIDSVTGNNKIKHLRSFGLYVVYENLTTLDLSSCTNLEKLNCSYSSVTSLNVSGCTNLTVLYHDKTQLISLDISYTSLTELIYNYSPLTSLNVTGCTKLIELYCSSNQLTSLTVSGCPNLIRLWCSNNQLTSLNVSGCTNLTSNEFGFTNNPLISLTVSGCPNLTYLQCGNYYTNTPYFQLTSLKVSDCPNLTFLSCNDNQITSLNVSDCPNLTYLNCFNNQLTSLNVSVFKNLTDLGCDKNRLTSLNFTGCTNLTKLGCSENQLASLNVDGLKNLSLLRCNNNRLTSLNVGGFTNLTELNCGSNQLTSSSLNISNCTNLSNLSCDANRLTSLNVSGFTNLTELICDGNQLTSLNVSGCTNLTYLRCNDNQLKSLNVSGCTNLTHLGCEYNQLTSLIFTGCTNLTNLYCRSNQLTSLNVSGCTNLINLYCNENQLAALNASGCTNLTDLHCQVNKLAALSFTGCSNLTRLWCDINQLSDENLPSLYGLNIKPVNGYFSLLSNKGFTESAIRKLADNLPYISYEQILWDKISDENSLSVSPTSLDFSVSGGRKTFTVTSNVDWTVSCDSSWVTFSPPSGTSNGTVTVTVEPNATAKQRTAEINVSGTGVEEQTVSVTQSAADVYLTVSPSSLNFAASGGQQPVTVTSNTEWTVSSNAFEFNVSPSSGENDGTFMVTVTANPSTIQRTAILTVAGPGDEPKRTISIVQDPPPAYLTVSTDSLNFSGTSGEEKTFIVLSNTSWTVSCDATWLKIYPTSGANDGEVKVTVAQNLEPAPPREAIITVSGEGVAKQTIIVTQGVILNTSWWYITPTMLAMLTYSNGILFISTSESAEAMPGFTVANPPWYEVRGFISTVFVGKGATTIGQRAFANCFNLTNVNLFNTVVSIEREAFFSCDRLESFAFADTIMFVGAGAFAACNALTFFQVDPGNSVYSSDAAGVLYNKNKTALHTCPAGKTGTFTIPGTVRTIGEMAFYGCKNISRVRIPSAVTSIGPSAFEYCTGLKEVTVNWTTPLSVPDSLFIFRNVSISTATLHVPAGTKALYRAADVWKDFGTITEDGSQGVIPEEMQPVGIDGKGKIELSLSIPSDATLTGSFEIRFPEGMTLDEESTALSPELSDNFYPTFTSEGNNTWLVDIKSNETRSAMASEYRIIMDIAYRVNENVQKGTYEAIFMNLDFVLDDKTPIQEESLTVTINVLRDPTSVENTGNSSFFAYIINNKLKIESSQSELITIYSVTGTRLYSGLKNVGLIEVPISSLPGSVFIIKGSVSGVIKVVK